MLTTYWIPTNSNGLRRELQNAFRQFENHTQPRTEQPPLTVWEDDQGVSYELDVPGIARDSLDVRIQEGQLWITGERTLTTENRQCRHNERMFGPFGRRVPLPDMIDPASIEAELNDGVLVIAMKKKSEAQPRRVEIKSSASDDHTPRISKD